MEDIGGDGSMTKWPLLCGVLFLLVGCGADSMCSSKTLQVARDPGSDRFAATIVRDCGATTGYVTAILIGHTAESSKAATEVFVADSDHGAADDAGGGAIWTNVVWIAPGKLAVAHASKAHVSKQLPSATGASITYRASDPLSSPLVD
ncbi:hypothetical protein ABIC65_004032 [Sphingomonas trueperi]|uniref:hypothetical protein n=1 Tax=Sphingomonas trueperi TaxID=53317 RepID=UPI00339323FC